MCVLQGMLLHGPPGTGKTLIARQIGKMLNGKEPKVVNGPEVLSKYVGQAEENIRNLFGEAEAEYKEKGDASVSEPGLCCLHVFKATCRPKAMIGLICPTLMCLHAGSWVACDQQI